MRELRQPRPAVSAPPLELGSAWNLISFATFFFPSWFNFDSVELPCPPVRVRLRLTSAAARSSRNSPPPGGRSRAARVSMAAAPIVQRAKMPRARGDVLG